MNFCGGFNILGCDIMTLSNTYHIQDLRLWLQYEGDEAYRFSYRPISVLEYY